MADYYKILGIPETASEDEIRQAYTRLAVEYHPAIDRSNSSRFQDIQIAYRVLSNLEEKAIYDAEREEVDVSLFTTESLVQVFRSRLRAEEQGLTQESARIPFGTGTIMLGAVAAEVAVHSYREKEKSTGDIYLGVTIFLAGAGAWWAGRTLRKMKKHEREIRELPELIKKYSKLPQMDL